MARIRTVKPEFFIHEELQDLERDHAELKPMLVFAGLWGHCDRLGRFEWKPRTLKLGILPFLDFDLGASLLLLWEAGIIKKYESGGKAYGFIPSFDEHQRINGKEAQAPAKYPEPLEFISTDPHGTDGEASGKHPGAQEGKGREEEGKKRVAVGSADADPPPEQPEFPVHVEHQPPEVATPPADTKPPKQEAKSAATFAAYAEAYQKVYGAPPIRNRETNAKLCAFVDRIGAEEAPHVAAFFLRHPSAFYRSRGHSVGCMLQDAEKLRTEWATGCVTTATTARQQERTASNAAARVAAQLRAQEQADA